MKTLNIKVGLLRAICALLIIAIFCVLFPSVGFCSLSYQKKQLAELATKYHLVIQTENERISARTQEGTMISARKATDQGLEGFIPIFLSEFSVYPIQTIKRAGIRKIIICEGLKYGNQERAAVPDWDHGILYYDVSSDCIDPGIRRCLHHDLFHMIDCQDDLSFEDDSWKCLNRRGFKYGAGGEFMQDVSYTVLGSGSPGFLNKYCTSGVEEDKAEIFAYLMTNHKVFKERASDAVLQAKVNLLKKELWSFDKSFDSRFWNEISRRPSFQ